MRRLLPFLLIALLTTGCTQRIVTAKTIEQSDTGPRVCVSYRYTGAPKYLTAIKTCSDEHGEPLNLRCYNDAKIGGL